MPEPDPTARGPAFLTVRGRWKANSRIENDVMEHYVGRPGDGVGYDVGVTCGGLQGCVDKPDNAERPLQASKGRKPQDRPCCGGKTSGPTPNVKVRTEDLLPRASRQDDEVRTWLLIPAWVTPPGAERDRAARRCDQAPLRPR